MLPPAPCQHFQNEGFGGADPHTDKKKLKERLVLELGMGILGCLPSLSVDGKGHE